MKLVKINCFFITLLDIQQVDMNCPKSGLLGPKPYWDLTCLHWHIISKVCFRGQPNNHFIKFKFIHLFRQLSIISPMCGWPLLVSHRICREFFFCEKCKNKILKTFKSIMTSYLHSMGRTVRIWVMTCRCTWLKTGGAKIKIVTDKALETSASKITLKK